ncbi:unnamed protein product [Plutella xylostella]|uniref:(diamondback moth) hypothetical protein n=1 Tax=Plutella xylostella TaxID=51655 RepID=A0A8S4E1D4_PLUXY|nr:unnamed protein product [Plutella xylostella]
MFLLLIRPSRDKNLLIIDSPQWPPPEQSAAPQSPPKSPVQSDQLNKENAMLPPAEGATAPRRNSLPSRDNTPKGKPGHADDNDMSPASRYIAMARQGLLGCDSQETPKRVGELRDDAKQDGDVRTPPLDDALSTPNLRCLSPTTRRRLQAVKRGEMPSDPIRTPTDPFEKNRTETPDSAFGAALRPGSGRLSPDARKRLWQFVQELPGKEPQTEKQKQTIAKDESYSRNKESAFGAALRPGSGRLSPDARKRLWQFVQELPGKEPQTEKQKQTPLSEIRNRFLAQFNGDAPTPPSDSHSLAPRKLHLQDQEDTPPHKMAKFSMDQSPGTATTNRHSNHETPKPSIPTTPKPTPLPNNTIDASKLSTIDATKASTPEAKLGASVDLQLQRLSAALSARGSTPVQRHKRTRDSLKPLPGPESEAAPESQPNTVGWDDRTPAELPAEPPATLPKRFMLSSNVDGSCYILQSKGPESEAAPESQPNTVGWDDRTPAELPTKAPATLPKRFMLSSNVDNREDLMSMIIHLGGEVSDGSELDPSATHLLCAAPARSEKMLGSIAHGKWVLHPAYVARSRANGAFLNLDPSATHLLCAAPARSEKMLGSIAHGKWVLHPAYVARSRANGPFLNYMSHLRFMYMYNAHIKPESVIVGEATIEVVQEYVYLGQSIRLGRSNFDIDKEAARRIQLGWAAFGKLRHIFSLAIMAIPQSLKTKDFNQCVLPVMTYGYIARALGDPSALRRARTLREDAEKWDPGYVARSRANGAFLNEEEYEWGNDLATCLPPLGTSERTLARAAHRWRVARAQRQPGAFSGVVALLHVPAARRRLLARLLRAGDGEVIQAE